MYIRISNIIRIFLEESYETIDSIHVVGYIRFFHQVSRSFRILFQIPYVTTMHVSRRKGDLDERENIDKAGQSRRFHARQIMVRGTRNFVFNPILWPLSNAVGLYHFHYSSSRVTRPMRQ